LTATIAADERPLSSPDGPSTHPQSDYALLKKRIQDAGLLGKRPGYYSLAITANLSLFALCIALLFLTRNVWLQALIAVGLGLSSGQLGFQLHDAGHRQMFKSQWKNALVGLITADALLGMSYGWWVQKHNRHHGNPNDVDLDPDIEVGAIAYNEQQALGRRGPWRELTKYQAYFFFPLTTFLAWSMHFTGVRYLVTEESKFRRTEFAMLAAHAAIYLGGLIYLLGPWTALLVVVIHKGVGGAYLASVFAPNHKGMLQTDANNQLDFVRTQVLTARNVRSHPVTDYWYGSLNYQIEHHLFPGMARPSVRKAQPIVKAFCAERGIDYCETGFLQSYRELLSFLHEVGAPLRKAAAQSAV
jgi:fatty acid desaturase